MTWTPSKTARALVAWYRPARRDLPWRRTADPYAVWVSEVMLQQTRVETAIPYYARFLARFPTLDALAAAPEASVLRLWQGLGYYARARHLQAAARQVLREHQGHVPRSAAALRRLPGVGEYTAAAIASICFGERVAVLDGNVLRVAARVLSLRSPARGGETLRAVREWLAGLIATRSVEPGELNQALMELGATRCRPEAPACEGCPLHAPCLARAGGTPELYPVKTPLRAIPTRHVAGWVLWRNGRLLLRHRQEERLLQGTWELPGGAFDPQRDGPQELPGQLAAASGLTPLEPRACGTVRQVYSHFRLELHLYESRRVEGRLTPALAASHRWVRPEELDGLPISNAPRKALARVLPRGSVAP